ncbi:hypothetical protein [Streptomyces sp. NPDC051211]
MSSAHGETRQFSPNFDMGVRSAALLVSRMIAARLVEFVDRRRSGRSR